MGKKRLIDCDELYFCELWDELGERGVHIYERLWSLAEDWGGYEPKLFDISMQCGALRATIDEVRKCVEKLVALKKIISYEVGGREYHWIVKFLKHQPLDNPAPPHLPLPPWIVCTLCRYKSGKKYAKYEIDTSRLPEGYRHITSSLPVNYEEPTGRSVTKRNSNVTNSNGNEKKGKDTEPYVQCSEYVFMKPSERAKLAKEYGEENTKAAITILDNYKGSKGIKYKSDYRAILSWVIDKMQKEGKLKKFKIEPQSERQQQLRDIQEAGAVNA